MPENISPIRTAFRWQVVNSIRALAHKFLTIPDEELKHISLFNWTRVCGALITYTNMVWAILDEIKSPDTEGTAAGPAVDSGTTDRQRAEAQLVIDEVQYFETVDALIDKTDYWYRWYSPEEKARDIISQFGLRLKRYLRRYLTQIRQIFGLEVQPHHRPVDDSRTSTSRMMSGMGGDAEDWQMFETVADDDFNPYTGEWESLLNSFTVLD